MFSASNPGRCVRARALRRIAWPRRRRRGRAARAAWRVGAATASSARLGERIRTPQQSRGEGPPFTASMRRPSTRPPLRARATCTRCSPRAPPLMPAHTERARSSAPTAWRRGGPQPPVGVLEKTWWGTTWGLLLGADAFGEQRVSQALWQEKLRARACARARSARSSIPLKRRRGRSRANRPMRPPTRGVSPSGSFAGACLALVGAGHPAVPGKGDSGGVNDAQQHRRFSCIRSVHGRARARRPCFLSARCRADAHTTSTVRRARRGARCAQL